MPLSLQAQNCNKMNTTKSWNVGSMANRAKVREAEEKAAAEDSKMQQLRRELEDTRERERLRTLQEEAGLAVKSDRIEWMYQGIREDAKRPTAEDFLTSKTRVGGDDSTDADTLTAEAVTPAAFSAMTAARREAIPGVDAAPEVPLSQAQQQRLQRDDPLEAIRAKEAEVRARQAPLMAAEAQAKARRKAERAAERARRDEAKKAKKERKLAVARGVVAADDVEAVATRIVGGQAPRQETTRDHASREDKIREHRERVNRNSQHRDRRRNYDRPREPRADRPYQTAEERQRQVAEMTRAANARRDRMVATAARQEAEDRNDGPTHGEGQPEFIMRTQAASLRKRY